MPLSFVGQSQAEVSGRLVLGWHWLLLKVGSGLQQLDVAQELWERTSFPIYLPHNQIR